MKKIQAIIKCHRFEEVLQELWNKAGVRFIMTEVKGFGRQKYTNIYRGSDYSPEFFPRVMIEAIVPDDKVDEVVKIIEEAARTGKVGDGRIFISEITDAISIRTGERGKEALGYGR
jgi:nitrogen regulatory protein P-II 1